MTASDQPTSESERPTALDSAPPVAGPTPTPTLTPTPSRPPPRGHGLLALGVVGVIVGAGNVAFGTTFLVSDPDGVGVFGVAPLTIGAAFVAAGAVGIHYAKRRRAAHRQWEQASGMDLDGWRAMHPAERPPPGLGMVVAGSLVGVGGLGLLAGTTVIYVRQDRPPASVGVGMFVGAAATVTGAMLVGFGSPRVHQHRRKQAATAQLVPVPVFGAQTYGFGVAGRF
ncbi:hypothetical protein DB30_01192 [Enhygromyxa salina]|uniref:Uncharacterized protein n=1 Tax=Enhygromyxa salina TaxID=215803 RepID=A0A0C2CXS9_9BACT|nr:hypothetical protein DB30_01192 [Enhygromyxa salina]